MVSSDEELTWLESFEEEGCGVTLFEGALPLELFDLLLVLEFAGLERLDERGMLANYCVVMRVSVTYALGKVSWTVRFRAL